MPVFFITTAYTSGDQQFEYMNYQQEQNEWDEFVRRTIGVETTLLNISVNSSDCRIYQAADSVYKIRRLTPASCRDRLNSLEDETLILGRMASISATPRPRHYMRTGAWEVLEMSVLPPLPVHDPTFRRPRESMQDFLRVARLVWQLNRMGCSHGDFNVHNVGRNVEGTLSLFDFDQACIANPLLCWLRDFLGIGIYARPNDVSLLRRARNVQIIWPLVKILGLPKRIIKGIIRGFQGRNGQFSAAQTSLQSRVALLEDVDLTILAEAWMLAARSSASSPGVHLAYYSLDISGINFPGERPWLLRWDSIRRNIDFKGKRFLELGSNLGLLSIHARLNGASACLGLDIDYDIVRAASLAARAFQVDVEFRQLSLDDPANWEVELGDFDIVSALSVVHWVKDKERVWAFLGRHREVIYEGHESDDEAENNLRRSGFTRVLSLGQSERGRKMFYATKDV